jgi:hypothetical protein
MQPRSALAALAVAFTCAGVPFAADPPEGVTPTGALHRNLPRDPIAVLAFSVEDPLQSWEGLLDLSGRLGDAETRRKVANALEELSRRSGIALDTELLAQLGPQIALSLDLPPIDQAAIALQAGQPGAMPNVLAGIGLVAQVRQAERLDQALRALLALGGAPASEGPDGLVTARMPVAIHESGPSPSPGVQSDVTVHYIIRDGRIAIGFSPAWVLAAHQSGPPETKLAAGEDFSRVFAQLDPAADRITYVNLPKVRSLVTDSQIVTAVLLANPKTSEVVRLLAAKDVMEVGLGSTSVPVAGGVRTTNFGPYWLAGPVMSSGVVAALAVPALLLTEGDPDGHATLEDIREIAQACEGFSTDTRRFPRTQGWVPIERIALYLEPVYAHDLARLDEWENPILYWSDGSNYRILSTGEDGEMDRDWSGALEAHEVAEGGDIVFGDGRVLSLPSSLGSPEPSP